MENDNYQEPETKFVVTIWSEYSLQNNFIVTQSVLVKILAQARRPRFLRGFYKIGNTNSAPNKKVWLQIDLKRVMLIEAKEVTEAELNNAGNR